MMLRAAPSAARTSPLALLALLSVGCAQNSLGVSPGTIMSTVIMAGEAIGAIGGVGSSTSSGTVRRIPASGAASVRASRVLKNADQYVGTKYTWGGNTPKSGFDCSGFTKYVFPKE